MGWIADSDELRAAVFAFLDELQGVHGPYLTRAQINAFGFDGQPLSLMVQNGIRTPSRWTDPLTITSTRRDEAAGGYWDKDRSEGLRLYRYMRERSSAAPALNRSLDLAAMSGRPLGYFIEVGDARYEPIYPVLITDTERHGVLVSDVPATGEYADLIDLPRYERRETNVRLHQREFRSRVLYAYAARCCVTDFRRCTVARSSRRATNGTTPTVTGWPGSTHGSAIASPDPRTGQRLGEVDTPLRPPEDDAAFLRDTLLRLRGPEGLACP